MDRQWTDGRQDVTMADNGNEQSSEHGHEHGQT